MRTSRNQPRRSCSCTDADPPTAPAVGEGSGWEANHSRALIAPRLFHVNHGSPAWRGVDNYRGTRQSPIAPDHPPQTRGVRFDQSERPVPIDRHSGSGESSPHTSFIERRRIDGGNMAGRQDAAREPGCTRRPTVRHRSVSPRRSAARGATTRQERSPRSDHPTGADPRSESGSRGRNVEPHRQPASVW